jgi:hypothetical protein
MSDTAEILFTRARLRIVSIAAEASGLPGLTPVEREQMRTLAGIAALHLHRVDGPSDDADSRAARADVSAITRPVLQLFRTIFEAAHCEPLNDETDAPGSARANGAAWQADSDRGEWS